MNPVRNSRMDKNIEQFLLEVGRPHSTQKEKFSNGVNRREFLKLAAGTSLAAVIPFSGCGRVAASPLILLSQESMWVAMDFLRQLAIIKSNRYNTNCE